MFVSVRAQKYAEALWRAAQDCKLEESIATVLAHLVFGENVNLSRIITVKSFPSRTYASVTPAKVARLFGPKKTELSHIVGRFIGQLVMHRRLKLLPQVARAYYNKKLLSEGKIAVTIRSPKALKPTEIKELSRALERQLGRSPEIIFEEAPEVLGGVEITANGTRYDMTLLGRLNRIRKRLHSLLDSQEI